MYVYIYIYIDTYLSIRPETQVSKPFQCDQTWPWSRQTPNGGLPQPSGSSIRWIAEAGPFLGPLW